MRSPKHRTITGRYVRLPLVLTVAVAAALVSLAGVIGLLIGNVGDASTDRDPSPVTAAAAVPASPAPAGIAVTDLTVSAGQEPVPLGVGEEADVRVVAALADGTSREDAPVRWFSSNTAVLAVDKQGRVTGLAPGQARVHAVLPPFDASAAFEVGPPGLEPSKPIPSQPDPDHLVRLEQRLLDWAAWIRSRQGLSTASVDEARRGTLRALVAHALRQGGMDRVRLDARQLRAAEAGGWAVRLWPVGTPAAWDVADLGEIRDLIGAEAVALLTDADAVHISAGLVYDARASDQLWAAVAVNRTAA